MLISYVQLLTIKKTFINHQYILYKSNTVNYVNACDNLLFLS